MRVAVVSHSCVVDVNQQVLVALRHIPGTEVGLLVPANWVSEYTGEAMAPKILPEVDFPVWQEPVVKPGHVSLHFYKHLPLDKIKAFAPEVLLSMQEPWSLSGLQAMWLANRLRIPFLFQTNQNILKQYPPPFSWIEKTSYRRAAVALAYSEEARQVMLSKGLKAGSFVVPYATDVSRFTPGRREEALRETLGLTGCTVIGYMGRLVPEKGLDTVLEAVRRLDQTASAAHGSPGRDLPNPGDRVKVLLVGAGPEEGRLRGQAETLGISADRLVFAGVVPHSEAGRYLSCMDIFVLPSRTTPSWKEQFGRVLIEALACGVPVVGSDSGQIPHLIRETGGGLIFREGDAEDLADKLGPLIASLGERERLARTGGAAVQAHFTCEAVAARLHKLLEAARDGRSMVEATDAAAVAATTASGG